MEKATIVPRSEYAIREERVPGSPFQHIQVLEHIRRNKWKARWIDPNPGLVDYVESVQIIVPWKDRKAFLRDEENAERIAEYNRRCGYKGVSPIENAVQQVFESSGEQVSFSRGILTGSGEAIGRIRARAKDSEEKEGAFSYVDRSGILHLPFDACVDLARKFCAAEPSTVLVGVETTERE